LTLSQIIAADLVEAEEDVEDAIVHFFQADETFLQGVAEEDLLAQGSDRPAPADTMQPPMS
jgi:hypothetical protein